MYVLGVAIMVVVGRFSVYLSRVVIINRSVLVSLGAGRLSGLPQTTLSLTGQGQKTCPCDYAIVPRSKTRLPMLH